ncbi:MAG: DUF3563 family protein [Burkholderiales bacterium]
MNNVNHAFPEHSVIGTCIKLAHATFYDALPSNAAHLAPAAPVTIPGTKRTPPLGVLQRWAEAFDRWSYKQTMKEREAYLAQSQDIFELEARLRHMDGRPYY